MALQGKQVRNKMDTRANQFESLYQKALNAGEEAIAPLLNDRHWGCGSATVCVKGNTAFGRWAVREKNWSRRHPRGVGLSISYPLVPRELWQSENHKSAYARAFAAVLEAADIEAWVETLSD
jgi:hypothetical protein